MHGGRPDPADRHRDFMRRQYQAYVLGSETEKVEAVSSFL